MTSDLLEAVRDWRSAFLRQKADQEIPGHTCPMIDGVLESLGDGDCVCLGLVERRMEKIRSANLDLRTLGRDWYEFARDMLDDLEMTIKIANKKEDKAA
jgi:hypothetical protein